MTGKKDLIKQAMEMQEKVNQLILEYSAENWLSLDLTIAQLKSIVYIYSKGKTNLRELAQALDVTPSVVTGIVDRLILHGMINRTANPNDRRSQWLTVTDKGEALLDNIRQKSSQEISHILGTLSPKDLSTLVRGFSAFIKSAELHLNNKTKATRSTADDKRVPLKLISKGQLQSNDR